eukprot:6120599-Prymnesium_polylepis.1
MAHGPRRRAARGRHRQPSVSARSAAEKLASARLVRHQTRGPAAVARVAPPNHLLERRVSPSCGNDRSCGQALAAVRWPPSSRPGRRREMPGMLFSA